MYAWTKSQNSFQGIQTVRMFSKAKSCKVMTVFAGTDHPAFRRSLGDCRGPQQPPEQELQTCHQQRVLLPGCLQDNSTQPAEPPSAPQGWWGHSQGCGRTCSLGRQIPASYPSVYGHLTAASLIWCHPRAVLPTGSACAACRDHTCKIWTRNFK